MAWMNLEPALKRSLEDFSRRDPEAMAFNARVFFNDNQFKINFLGKEFIIYYPNGEIKYPGENGDISPSIKIILLHYLTKTTPALLEGRLISFKELPGGHIYTVPFTNRVIKPLIKYFGEAPEKLLEAGERLSGRREQLGNVSVSVPALPKIPLTFVLWLGDEEFPPSGNVLFDASAKKHLQTEDYVVLSEVVLYQIRRLVF